MTCMENCNPCKARPNYICHGDFYTTGEYGSILNEFGIHGVTLNQKIDSVKELLDENTLKIIKVFICDSNRWPYSTDMEIVFLLDEIISRLSDDNNSYVPGDDTHD